MTITNPLNSCPRTQQVYTNGVSTTRGSINNPIHITTRIDETTGEEVVLWKDILRVFNGASYIMDGSRVVPFMTGENFEE